NPEGETKPAFEAALVTVSGRHISVYGVEIDLRMETRDVVFHKGADAKGDAVLVAQRAREGQLVLSAAQLDLEEAIGRIAGERARSTAPSTRPRKSGSVSGARKRHEMWLANRRGGRAARRRRDRARPPLGHVERRRDIS